MTVTTSFLKTTGAVLPNTATCPKLITFLRPTLPDEDGLVGMYLLGGSAAMSARNLVAGGAAMTMVGAPAIDPALGATCSQVSCFDTGLPETAAWTFLTVAKPPQNPSSPIFPIGLFGTNPGGAGIYVTENVVATQGTNANTGDRAAAAVAIASPQVADWYQFFARGDAASVDAAYRYKGAEASTNGYQAGHIPSNRTIRIGGAYDTGYTASSQVAFAAVWTKKLTDAGRDAAMAAVAQFFSDYGGVSTL